MNRRTRYRDKDGEPIYLGDVVYVEEYPEKYVGGSYEYEALIELENGVVVATYYDIGERESIPLKHFPVAGRTLLPEEDQKAYWRTAYFGSEPPEEWWRRDIYRKTPYKLEEAYNGDIGDCPSAD